MRANSVAYQANLGQQNKGLARLMPYLLHWKVIAVCFLSITTIILTSFVLHLCILYQPPDKRNKLYWHFHLVLVGLTDSFPSADALVVMVLSPWEGVYTQMLSSLGIATETMQVWPCNVWKPPFGSSPTYSLTLGVLLKMLVMVSYVWQW